MKLKASSTARHSRNQNISGNHEIHELHEQNDQRPVIHRFPGLTQILTDFVGAHGDAPKKNHGQGRHPAHIMAVTKEPIFLLVMKDAA